MIKTTKEFIEALASKHGIRYAETPIDAIAQKFSELSGDKVEDDATLNLLLALRRQNIISTQEMANLTHNYLNEKHQGQAK